MARLVQCLSAFAVTTAKAIMHCCGSPEPMMGEDLFVDCGWCGTKKVTSLEQMTQYTKLVDQNLKHEGGP